MLNFGKRLHFENMPHFLEYATVVKYAPFLEIYFILEICYILELCYTYFGSILHLSIFQFLEVVSIWKYITFMNTSLFGNMLYHCYCATFSGHYCSYLSEGGCGPICQ